MCFVTLTTRKKSTDYQSVLDRIGRCGNLSSKIHQKPGDIWAGDGYSLHHKNAVLAENQLQIEAIRKDIAGLSDHGTYLTGRVNFLLDATGHDLYRAKQRVSGAFHCLAYFYAADPGGGHLWYEL